MHRAYWRENGMLTKDTSTATIETTDYQDVFSHVGFRRTHDAGISTDDNASFWRVVGVDALGPIVTETETCLRLLREIHCRFQKQEEVTNWPSRFPQLIPTVPGQSERPPTNSRYLKALLALATASASANFDQTRANDIAREVGIGPTKGRRSPSWMTDFHDSMEETHLRRANLLVRKLYRWLVHAQISLAQ